MSEIDPHDYEYVVMSEAQGRHYVVVRRKSGSVWLQVVASFSDRDRAVMYADLENMIHEDRVVDPTDPPRADQDIYAEPPGHEVASGLPGLVEVIRSVTVTGTETRRTVTPPLAAPAPALTAFPASPPRPTTTLADEVLAALPALVERHPKGPTVRAIAEHLSAEEHEVRRAVRSLDEGGRAVLMRRKDSASYHLVPLGHRPPAESLTKAQADVLRVLRENADATGAVQMSKRDITERAGCSHGSIVAVLDALIYKRRIAELERGTGTIPTTYRVLAAVEPEPVA